jgi:hypothetical protein
MRLEQIIYSTTEWTTAINKDALVKNRHSGDTCLAGSLPVHVPPLFTDGLPGSAYVLFARFSPIRFPV